MLSLTTLKFLKCRPGKNKRRKREGEDEVAPKRKLLMPKKSMI